MAVTVSAIKQGALSTSDTDIVPVTSGKSTVVKNIRFVNLGSGSATLDIRRQTADGTHQILAPTLALPAGFTLIEDQEITLGPSDKILGKLAASGTVHFVVSGIQRDV